MIDKQIEQLVLLGISEVDREIILHYLDGKDYNAAKKIVDKTVEVQKQNNIHIQATEVLKTFIDSKVELYSHFFEDVPFDVISDHTNTKSYEGEEFG